MPRCGQGFYSSDDGEERVDFGDIKEDDAIAFSKILVIEMEESKMMAITVCLDDWEDNEVIQEWKGFRG